MSLKLFDLSGKRALITGSSQGIGYGIAKGLAEAGAEIILNGRNEPKLATAAASLRKAGYKVQVAAFDVSENVGFGFTVTPKLIILPQPIASIIFTE